MIKDKQKQSPEYVKISAATAISLGLLKGRMYRGAVNRCVNILVHYPEGCSANCAYCGLAKKRPGNYQDKSFINVPWPIFSLEEAVTAINNAPSYVQRSCISMITNGKCPSHTIEISKRLIRDTNIPVSVLVSPTVMDDGHLKQLKEAGVDKVGIALDLATEGLFDRHRGSGVNGPHRWKHYWDTVWSALKVFGQRNVGVHLMVGMGETEEEMSWLMSRLWNMGVVNHLFSFFAEEDSLLSKRPQPQWSVYLRIQLARYMIEEGVADFSRMRFDQRGRIADFGIPKESVDKIVREGSAFMTSGCLGRDGTVACNRPFGNCMPGIRQWNYPYHPDCEEIALIDKHLMDM